MTDPREPLDELTSSLLALVKTGDWLDAQRFPPTQWAVPGLIPQGFGLFTGPPKAGKSWAVLGIALAIASGGVALGQIPVGRPRPVFYLALEDGDARLQARCRKLLEGARIPEHFHEVTTGIMPAQVLPLIRAWLHLHGDLAPLILLDTLGKVMPPALAGEGAYQRDYRVGSALKAVVDEHPGATLLVVHHTRKVSSEDWMDGTSGTNGLNGSADWTMNLHRPRNSASGTLRVTGRDVAEGEYAVTCEEGIWALDGRDLPSAARQAETLRETGTLGDRSSEILAFVNGRVGSVTAQQVADDLDIPEARRYLARLAESGRVQRVGRGLYAAVPSVPTVPDGPTDPLSPQSQVSQPATADALNPSQECVEFGTHVRVGTHIPRGAAS